MGFHRLTVPSYTGGLPGGYDYINNAISGTPALADGVKAGGLNTGTYFVGLADDSTSEATNRPHLALAQNCDFLDNLFHRDIAVREKTAPVTAVGVVPSITVAGVGQFLGSAGTPNTTEGIATFVEVVDSNGDPIFGGGLPVRVTSITGDTPGVGFSAVASITYNLTPSIPNSTTYQLLYSARGNLANLPVNQLSEFKARSYLAERTAYDGSGANTWANGGVLSPSSVASALNTIVNSLGGILGAAQVGSGNLSPWHDASVILADSVVNQLSAITSTLGGTSGSLKIGYHNGPAWADTTANPTTSVEAMIDKIINDLGGPTGTAKIFGAISTSTWDDGTTIASNRLSTQLNAIISTLGSEAINNSGAKKIGSDAHAGSVFSVAAGSLASQVDALQTELDDIRVSGVEMIVRFSTLAALRAFPSPGEKHVYVVDNIGVFQYISLGGEDLVDNGFDVILPNGYVVTDSNRYYLLGPKRRLVNKYYDISGSIGQVPTTSYQYFGQNLSITSVSVGDVIDITGDFFVYALTALPVNTGIDVDMVLTKNDGTTILATSSSVGIYNHFSASAPSTPYSSSCYSRLQYVPVAADLDFFASRTLHVKGRYTKNEAGGAITARADLRTVAVDHYRG